MSATEKEKLPVFDATRPIRIRLTAGTEKKEIVLRFPTDDEWCEWRRKRKVIIKQLGRGKSQTIIPDAEDVDAELVAKLRTDGDATQVDRYEAAMLVEQLNLADVDDVYEFPGGLHVALRVPGGITHHDMQMLSAKDLLQYRRAFAQVMDLPYNKQELTINLPAAGELYKKLNGKSDDYAGTTPPITHQAAVIKAAVDAIESGLGVADSENP